MDILFGLAILPAAVLMYYVWKKDPIEKEPTQLLVKLFLLGIASIIPAIILEMVLGALISPIYDISVLGYLLVNNFIGIALVEEGCKFFFLYRTTWRNPNFNYEFDGIVYAVFVSLGFAALENVMYVFDGGLATAIMRAITAVPGHCMFAVFMGYFFGLAKSAQVRGDAAACKRNMMLALVVPILWHGTYDFCCSVDGDIFLIVFFAVLVGMLVLGFRHVKSASEAARRIY